MIELLEKEKCEIFEIFEWPEILQVEIPHIQEKISFLKERGVPVSVGHLKCACGRYLSFPQLLKYYHLETQGKLKFPTRSESAWHRSKIRTFCYC